MLRLLLTKSPSIDETGCAMVILLPWCDFPLPDVTFCIAAVPWGWCDFSRLMWLKHGARTVAPKSERGTCLVDPRSIGKPSLLWFYAGVNPAACSTLPNIPYWVWNHWWVENQFSWVKTATFYGLSMSKNMVQTLPFMGWRSIVHGLFLFGPGCFCAVASCSVHFVAMRWQVLKLAPHFCLKHLTVGTDIRLAFWWLGHEKNMEKQADFTNNGSFLDWDRHG